MRISVWSSDVCSSDLAWQAKCEAQCPFPAILSNSTELVRPLATYAFMCSNTYIGPRAPFQVKGYPLTESPSVRPISCRPLSRPAHWDLTDARLLSQPTDGALSVARRTEERRVGNDGV